MEEFDAQINEVRDEVSKVVILNDETWEGLRCRICPSCATVIPTCFCVGLECGAQLISTGRFYIHISSDDDGDNQRPNVLGDARRAQEDAAAQEGDDEAEDVFEEDDMDTQGYTSGYMSGSIINTLRMAICLDEPREAQYMAMPHSKGSQAAHTTTTSGGTPTSLSAIRKGSCCRQRNRRFLNLIMFGQGPSGRMRSVMNTFV